MKVYHVTEVLAKYINWSMVDDHILAAACQRGKVVHAASLLYAKSGYRFAIAEMYQGYMDSFCRWFDGNVKEVIMAEYKMTDEVNGFTGQPDFLFELYSGEIVLTDIKTPIAEQDTWSCQLSTYSALTVMEHEIVPDDLISLRLRANGGKALGKRHERDRHKMYTVFLSALNAHRNLIRE